MTPAARVAAAIEVLDAWIAGTPVEQALTNWSRGARYAGSGDRAAVRDHVFDVLRARGSAEALGGGPGGRSLMIGLLRLRGIAPETVFTGQGHAPAPLSPGEAAAAGPAPGPEEDVPGWVLPMLTDRAGEALGPLLESFRRRAPLYLRVNAQKATRDAALSRLAGDGIEARPDPGAPHALEVVAGARRLRQSSAYSEGWVEPQDLSVQRAMAAVPWPTGRVLDYCAGGGGKALALAADGIGEVLAHDADPRRMSDLPARAARAGTPIARVSTPDLPASAPFAAVLCDVPCSGSGTWRRDPAAKWRLTPERLLDLQATQAAILKAAAPLVAPGGLLVYMTCSLFRAENEEIVAGFLAAQADWRCEGSGIDTPLTASDGFFHAVLRAPGRSA